MKKISLKMTTPNRLYSMTNIVLVVLFSIITFSCSKDDGTPTVVINELSQDVKDIIYFNGDEKASTVLITVPGGPSTKLATDIVDDISTIFDTTDLLNVTIHQAQTLDSTIVKDNDITLDQAVEFNAESIEMLSNVIKTFKDEGRTVYVLGFSFGTFITQELIAKKGITSADKYLIIAGRLDMNNSIWQAAAEGRNGYFENGVTPIIQEDLPKTAKERNLNRISAGFAMNRYTELWSTIDDLSNVTYIYGEIDQAVGSLTPTEVQFLESKNTNLIATPGNHDDTLGMYLVQGIIDAFGFQRLP